MGVDWVLVRLWGARISFVNFSGFFFFFCEFSCFFLLFLWFSEHALLVLPVVLLWWEFFSVYFSGFFGEFCWFSASDGLSAAPRVRNRSKSQRATTTHYVQPFVLLQLALGASDVLSGFAAYGGRFGSY